MNEAIILVAFGTSVAEAEAAYAHIEERVRAAFPDTEIRWAYTSRKIRRKLAAAGRDLPSPELVTAGLMQDGFKRVSVLSLQVIPGIEFHEVQVNLSLFGQMQNGIEQIVISRPLVSSHADCKALAAALLPRASRSRRPGEALLFMGHGTEKHPAYALYYALSAAFRELDPIAFVGCVMGVPDLQEIIPEIRKSGADSVKLVPLMAVAGEHARNDMAGPGEDSWRSILEREGLRCGAVLTGIAEYPEVVDIWIDHLRQARQGLKG